MPTSSSGGRVDKICPRCGSPYSWLERRAIGSQVYYYAVHEERVKGKRRIRKCYLGPDTYVAVSKTHFREGLYFRGLIDPSRALEYLSDLLNYVVRDLDLRPWVAESLARKLESAAATLRRLCSRELEAAAEVLRRRLGGRAFTKSAAIQILVEELGVSPEEAGKYLEAMVKKGLIVKDGLGEVFRIH